MALTPLDRVDRSTFRWLRVEETTARFRLDSGETPVGELVWASGPGSRASGHLASAEWSLSRIGFLNPQVSVRSTGSGAESARVSLHWHAHRIDVRGGSSYTFRRAGLLLPAWRVDSADGSSVLHIEPVREGRRLEGGAVVASAAGQTSPDLGLLLMVTWYFLVLAWFEDEALLPLEELEAAAPRSS